MGLNYDRMTDAEFMAYAQQQASLGDNPFDLTGARLQAAQQPLVGGGLFGCLGGAGMAQAQQQRPWDTQQRMYDQNRKPRKKVVSHTLSPQEAVNAAAKAVKDAQNLLT